MAVPCQSLLASSARESTDFWPILSPGNIRCELSLCHSHSVIKNPLKSIVELSTRVIQVIVKLTS